MHKALYTAAEIVTRINRIRRGNPSYKRALCILFCYFAPEIEALEPEFYEFIIQAFESQMGDLSFPVAFKSFFQLLPGLRCDDWAGLKAMIIEGQSSQPVKCVLRHDNLDSLRTLMRSSSFDMNKPFESEVYEPCIQAHDSLTLLAYAALCGASSCFQYLRMKGCDMSARDGKYYTIGHFAAIGGALDIIKQIVQGKCASDGLMQIATKYFRFSNYRQLHPKVDYVKPDKFGQLLVHVAAASNNIPVALRCLQFDREQVNLRESFGWTPLHSAVKKSNCDVIKLLMEMENVDLNARDSWGQTPLHVACQYGCPECVDLLLHSGKIDVNALNPAKVCLTLNKRHCISPSREGNSRMSSCS
jgi:ankyrin repeat protein